VTKAGYSAMLKLIYPAPYTPADVPADDGGEGEGGTTVATPRDTSDREPKTLTHEGAEGARETMRNEIVRAVLSGRGWPPSRADLILVCAALAINAGDDARALTGLPAHRSTTTAILDEITRWPDNRIALTCTALAITTMADELPNDRCVTLLTQLHTRYLGGEGDQSSRAAGAEVEDQTSLPAGEEAIDETTLTGRDPLQALLSDAYRLGLNEEGLPGQTVGERAFAMQRGLYVTDADAVQAQFSRGCSDALKRKQEGASPALPGHDQTDDAGESARPTTTAEARYEAGQLTKPATQQRTARKAPPALHNGGKVLSDTDTKAEGE
jgi:hypothetical protein